VFELAATTGAESDRSLLQLTPLLRSARYVPGTEFDRTELALDLAAVRASEYGEWRLDGGATRDTTLTSEWDGTGFVEARKWRRRNTMSPAWTGAVSAVAQLRARASYTDVYYEDARLTGLAGYDYRVVDVEYQREHGERTSARYSLYASRLLAPLADNTTDDAGFRAGGSYAWTGAGVVRWELGAHRTRTTTGDRADLRTGGLAQIACDGEFRMGRADVLLVRTVEPSGYGVLLQRDELRAGYRFDITQTVFSHIGARALRDAALGGDDVPERRYGRLDWRLGWSATPRWTISGGINYQWQDYVDDDRAAEGYGATIEVRYRGERHVY
jgi:hypothetical protein